MLQPASCQRRPANCSTQRTVMSSKRRVCYESQCSMVKRVQFGQSGGTSKPINCVTVVQLGQKQTSDQLFARGKSKISLQSIKCNKCVPFSYWTYIYNNIEWTSPNLITTRNAFKPKFWFPHHYICNVFTQFLDIIKPTPFSTPTIQWSILVANDENNNIRQAPSAYKADVWKHFGFKEKEGSKELDIDWIWYYSLSSSCKSMLLPVIHASGV